MQMVHITEERTETLRLAVTFQQELDSNMIEMRTNDLTWMGVHLHHEEGGDQLLIMSRGVDVDGREVCFQIIVVLS